MKIKDYITAVKIMEKFFPRTNYKDNHELYMEREDGKYILVRRSSNDWGTKEWQVRHNLTTSELAKVRIMLWK